MIFVAYISKVFLSFDDEIIPKFVSSEAKIFVAFNVSKKRIIFRSKLIFNLTERILQN